jgi:transcription antitermination factor NusG
MGIRYWYALQSKPHQEDALWQFLKAEEVESYYPRLPMRPLKRRAPKIRPYFPGYLFVRVDVHVTGVSKFNWMPHANGLVSFGDQPSPVPDVLICGIRQTINQLTCFGTQWYDELVHGERVRIHSGPFEGYEGIYDARIAGGERVRLLLELLNGQRVVLETDAARVEPIKRR